MRALTLNWHQHLPKAQCGAVSPALVSWSSPGGSGASGTGEELEPHNSHLWRNPKQTLKMLPGAAPGAGSATLAEGSHEGGSLGGLAQGPLAAAVPGSKGAGLGVKL